MFAVPDGSSSPPTTPDRRRRQGANTFSPEHPSTTPLGPPPTAWTGASTTPAGPPPPSSIFGSISRHDDLPPPVFGLGGRNAINHGSPLRQARQQLQRDAMAMDMEDDILDDINAFQNFQTDIPLQPIDTAFRAIARTFAEPTTDLAEPDGLILQTEATIQQIYNHITTHQNEPYPAIGSAVNHLLQVWNISTEASRTSRIGPDETSSGAVKAAFIASLPLCLHHPIPREAKSIIGGRSLGRTRPIPEVLLIWLRTFHTPFPNDLEDVINFTPNPAAHERFWDVVLNLTLRGQLTETIRLLQKADFGLAYTAFDDGYENGGYEGELLNNVQKVIDRTFEVLQSCPAVEFQDWNVTGPNWTLFRQKVHQALSDLQAFAEGNTGASPRNIKLGKTMSDMTYTEISRRLESRVPHSIYENLQNFYGQLLGSQNEVTAAASDWLEATLGMAIWWSGDDFGTAADSLAASQRMRRLTTTRPVDVNPIRAYRDLMIQSLQRMTEEDPDGSLQIDPASPVEVGLACVIDGDIASTLDVIQHLSLTVAAAFVDIASIGGWLGDTQHQSRSLRSGLDASDLMVLSFGQKDTGCSTRDDVLARYGSLLSSKGVLFDELSGREEQGWQLAVSILGRLDDETLAAAKISDVFSKVELTTDIRVENAVALCTRLGLIDQARKISERYADHLVSNSAISYGSAIIYYARAHSSQKLRELLSFLISCSVIRSGPYPSTPTPSSDPFSSMMHDVALQRLLANPKLAIIEVSRYDAEAADLLSGALAGYATLLRFYMLRDGTAPGHAVTLRPIARKTAAADALVALIQSSADSIHGGLFDAGVASAVPVDVLLCLLGEALPFLGDPSHRWLDSHQLAAILTAVEDLETAASRVRETCDECFKACLAEKFDSKGGDAMSRINPEDLLKKSISGLTGESEFSIIGSGLLKSSTEEAKGSEGAKRGWDWRSGLKRDAKGDQICKILRLQIAKEMAKSIVEGRP